MRDLTKGNIYKVFFKVSFPLIMAEIFSKVYNIIDTMIVGRFSGDVSVAAIGSVTPLINAFCTLFWGWVIGVGIIAGEDFGGKDYKALRTFMKTTLYYILIVSSAICVLIIVFHKPVFVFLNINEEIWASAFNYLWIYLLGIPAMCIGWLSHYIFNAVGETKAMMVASFISCGVNIVLDYIFVALFHWGTVGAAVATTIASVLSAVYTLFVYFRIMKQVNEDNENTPCDFSLISITWPLAIPGILQQFALYVAPLVIQPIINGISTSVTAGYSVAMTVFSLIACTFQGATRILQSYCAQCRGGGHIEDCDKSLVPGFVQALVYAGPMVILLVIFPDRFMSLFFAEGEMSGLPYAVKFISICLPFSVFAIADNLFHSYYKGIRAMKTVVAMSFISAFARIIPAFLLIDMGVDGVYIAIVISWVFEFLFGIFMYLFKFRSNAKHR